MESKFKQIYYSNNGYWREKTAIQKLSKASGSTKEEGEKWLLRRHYTKYIYNLQNIFLDLMRVCHYMPSQMILIRQILFNYLMTNTKRNYLSML